MSEVIAKLLHVELLKKIHFLSRFLISAGKIVTPKHEMKNGDEFKIFIFENRWNE